MIKQEQFEANKGKIRRRNPRRTDNTMTRGKNEPNGKHWSTKPHTENSRLINSFPTNNQMNSCAQERLTVHVALLVFTDEHNSFLGTNVFQSLSTQHQFQIIINAHVNF
jgi:hypothetical protein